MRKEGEAIKGFQCREHKAKILRWNTMRTLGECEIDGKLINVHNERDAERS